MNRINKGEIGQVTSREKLYPSPQCVEMEGNRDLNMIPHDFEIYSRFVVVSIKGFEKEDECI